MVRLESEGLKAIDLWYDSFQFLNGTIGVLFTPVIWKLLFSFQFLNGTIGVTDQALARLGLLYFNS